MSNFQKESVVHHTFDGRSLDALGANAAFKLGRDYEMDDLQTVMEMHGIGIAPGALEGTGMDAIQAPLFAASIPNLGQFFQSWLPGVVEISTQARLIDRIIGVSTVGNWEDEQVIQAGVELTGTAVPYGDHTNIPLASWNPSYNYRTIIRYELGFEVGALELARTSKMNMNSAELKRRSVALQLDIARNQVGFYGYNAGANFTYGFMNDPNLPAYVTVANPGSGTTWAVKTAQQIISDLITAFSQLRTQSRELIDPGTTPITLVVATAARDYLSKITDLGISVMEWLRETYPNVRVVSAPQLNAANGGSNVFIMFADGIADSGTDDGNTFMQIVPAKFMLIGMDKRAKTTVEDYSNAVAGIMVKRPWATVRFSGV